MTTRCMDCPAIIARGPRCHLCKAKRRTEGRPWEASRNETYYRAWGRCNQCRKPITMGEMECDHIVPIARGGSDSMENLQALCVTCHKAKTKREA